MNMLNERIALSDNTVLITGRTGTGKSHLAKELHTLSKRRDKKFVVINLATLSENLIESELFGHERGAFSGADQKRIGKLESANGGTVFLDEIGELSLRLQTKLLEALNSKVISPVGSNREIHLDIRMIAATNKDLKLMVKKQEFREDLFFRLNAFQIHLPGLAGNRDKIATLAKQFAQEASIKQNKNFSLLSPELSEELSGYPWPGNIRELKNAMDFAVAMSSSEILTKELLPPYMKEKKLRTEELSPELKAGLPTSYREAKEYFERIYFQETLRRFEGKVNLTARKSGISKVTLIEKIRKYEIDLPKIKYQSHLQAKEYA
jgi:DNA-binding NtrC family response regulator